MTSHCYRWHHATIVKDWLVWPLHHSPLRYPASGPAGGNHICLASFWLDQMLTPVPRAANATLNKCWWSGIKRWVGPISIFFLVIWMKCSRDSRSREGHTFEGADKAPWEQPWLGQATMLTKEPYDEHLSLPDAEKSPSCCLHCMTTWQLDIPGNHPVFISDHNSGASQRVHRLPALHVVSWIQTRTPWYKRAPYEWTKRQGPERLNHSSKFPQLLCCSFHPLTCLRDCVRIPSIALSAVLILGLSRNSTNSLVPLLDLMHVQPCNQLYLTRVGFGIYTAQRKTPREHIWRVELILE